MRVETLRPIIIGAMCLPGDVATGFTMTVQVTFDNECAIVHRITAGKNREYISIAIIIQMTSKRRDEKPQSYPFLFEHHSQPILPLKIFLRRMVKHGGAAFMLLGFSLGVGAWGYQFFGQLSWVDSFLNACMILTGMGPVDHLQTTGAKLFASIYALYSGIAFLTSIGIFFVPILHRLMHKFHLSA